MTVTVTETVNLLPWRNAQREKIQCQTKFIFRVCATLSLLIFLLLDFNFHYQIHKEKKQSYFLQKQLALFLDKTKDVSLHVQQTQQFSAIQKVMQAAIKQQAATIQLIHLLLTTLPQQMIFSELNFNKSTVRIVGMASSTEDFSRWISQLSGVKIIDIASPAAGGNFVFQIQVGQNEVGSA